jgi:hypothetical protein
VTAVAISNDGGRVATGSFDETACVWEVATGAKVCAAAKLGDRVTSIAISADGKRVVTGCADNTARIWDATTGDEIKVLRGHIDSVSGVAFLPLKATLETGPTWPSRTLISRFAAGLQIRAVLSSEAVTMPPSGAFRGSSARSASRH